MYVSVCVCMCVCVRERERERERQALLYSKNGQLSCIQLSTVMPLGFKKIQKITLPPTHTHTLTDCLIQLTYLADLLEEVLGAGDYLVM